MRLSLAAFLLAFTSVSTCMHITSPKENECVDLTKQLLVEWSADSSEVVATPFVSIRLANQRGAWPNVNEPLALGNDFEVPTRRGFIAFPRMGVENAEHFASINNG
ncbi:hypothetical protein N7478_009451 [Penicillium angulare]|uniref:uncharacterized protein n=1 Tax=Penicillium angulare TaxID=116970 RepID=UPI00253F9F47|nr:uncharacterized protein N7478_009451 [Penicillium angulare]KAJ5266643.1 hypothetical protein N7478_009451 [Penicillium angulare]